MRVHSREGFTTVLSPEEPSHHHDTDFKFVLSSPSFCHTIGLLLSFICTITICLLPCSIVTSLLDTRPKEGPSACHLPLFPSPSLSPLPLLSSLSSDTPHNMKLLFAISLSPSLPLFSLPLHLDRKLFSLHLHLYTASYASSPVQRDRSRHVCFKMAPTKMLLTTSIRAT
jgi:hypothetical protein